MTSEILTIFFELENSRNWAKYELLLHPNIIWTLFSPDGQETFYGKTAYMEKIKAAYNNNNVFFHCNEMLVSSNGNRIVTVLKNTYNEISVDIFEFEDGLIIREYEYLMN